MKLFNIKTFTDSYNHGKKFHHVELLGLKFRVANNKRSSTRETRTLYKTNRGIVLNLFAKRYICLINK
jgi:hypothetical protein